MGLDVTIRHEVQLTALVGDLVVTTDPPIVPLALSGRNMWEGGEDRARQAVIDQLFDGVLT